MNSPMHICLSYPARSIIYRSQVMGMRFDIQNQRLTVTIQSSPLERSARRPRRPPKMLLMATLRKKKRKRRRRKPRVKSTMRTPRVTRRPLMSLLQLRRASRLPRRLPPPRLQRPRRLRLVVTSNIDEATRFLCSNSLLLTLCFFETLNCFVGNDM